MTPSVPIVITAESERGWSTAIRAVRDTPVSPTALVSFGRDLAQRADPDHRYRTVVIATSPSDLQSLDDVAAGPTPRPGPLAFLFSGQSSQRPQMGVGLSAEFPRFATTVAAACDVVDPVLDRPLRDVFDDPGDGTGPRVIDSTEYTQPALMAYGMSTYGLLRSVGVRPDVVCGHSFGELIAAAAVGVWTASDAFRIAAERGRLIGAVPSGGGMIAIEATEVDVADAMSGTEVEFSALHSPTSVVVAGPIEQVRAIASTFSDRGVRTAELPSVNAFHSSAMVPVLEPLRAVFAAVPAGPTSVPLIGNATARILARTATADPSHWVTHCRQTVRWSEQMTTLVDAGTYTYLEVGPSGVLSRLACANLAPESHDSVIAAVAPDPDEVGSFLAALAHLDRRGHPVDWSAVYSESTRLSSGE